MLEQIEIDLWIRFFNDPHFHCMGAWDFPGGANNSARYVVISYVAVPVLEMIGLKVSLSTPSLSLSLWTLAVP